MDTIQLTVETCIAILTTAIETGAIQRWAFPETDGDVLYERDGNGHYVQLAMVLPNPITYEKKLYVISPDAIQRGVDVLMGDYGVSDEMKNAIRENDIDTNACDAIIQCALFGKVMFD